MDEFPGLADETSEIVVWEPEAKINHTEHISEYENCVATLKLMNDYMLKYGYIQINEDYVVGVSANKLNDDFIVENIDTTDVISFKFTDINSNVIYRLSYSEVELTEEFTKINEYWYVDVW